MESHITRVNKIQIRKFIIINFKFIDEHENEVSNNQEVELLSFKKIIKYNKEIINFLISKH